MTTAAIQTQSQALFEKAQTLMPGGVSSPVRAFKSVGGTPLFIERAQGPYIWDADGNRYIDYVGSWGPMILGHAHPHVVEAVREQALKGTSFGAPTAHENTLAELVIDAVPSIEQVRFVSSGTEAVMSAVRLARAYTGRDKLIKFIGCYHGHSDDLLVKAGSGVATLGIPDTPGIPQGATANTLSAPYNDLDAVKVLFDQYPNDIAAILVEPVAGNMGCVPPVAGYLKGLRDIATQYGALLIFDEVMTGFRVDYGGAQALYGMTPDITTLGKILGGGLPVGAYGASRDIMQTVAPAGPMYQAGTLSGNPLAMVAGIETLKQLKANPAFYQTLQENTRYFLDGMQRVAANNGLALHTPSVSAMFSLFFTDQTVQNYDDVLRCDKSRFNTFFHYMLQHGVYLAPSAFEAGFLSIAHTQQDLDQTLSAFEQWCSKRNGTGIE